MAQDTAVSCPGELSSISSTLENLSKQMTGESALCFQEYVNMPFKDSNDFFAKLNHMSEPSPKYPELLNICGCYKENEGVGKSTVSSIFKGGKKYLRKKTS
jgi:hypothetical protein